MRGAALLFFLLLASQAMADPRPYRPDITGDWPPAFPIFCGEHPKDCAPLTADEPSDPIDYLLWESRIDDVNRAVNSSMTYRGEEGDHWDDGGAFGDCDDYALTKRNKLISMGMPRGALPMAHVMLHGHRQMHLVLLVNTTYGFKVLDNRWADVYDLDQLMADRVSIQNAHNPKNWELQP
jgi:predicted transglutaminase-like cysteine proteinase